MVWPEVRRWLLAVLTVGIAVAVAPAFLVTGVGEIPVGAPAVPRVVEAAHYLREIVPAVRCRSVNFEIVHVSHRLVPGVRHS